MGVTLKCRHVVTPAEPTWQGVLPLSELDQVGVVSHTSVLYFYEKPPQLDCVDPSKPGVIDKLKDSLSRALVPFYPLAGRLSWVAGRRLQLDCNAMGVELIEAESTDNLSDFGDFVDSSRSMFRDLLPHMDYANKLIQELPLLSVQVTVFACGGICLGIEFSHVLMDGSSVFHFLPEWARLARGEPLQGAPYLDRLTLQHRTIDVDHEASDEPVDVPFAELGDAYSELHSSDAQHGTTVAMAKQLSPTLLLFTAGRIERLKKAANSNKEYTVSRPYTRFEAITAHVWRCMTMSRELEDDQITTLYAIVDARTRLDPPLPSRYFGNAIFLVTASTAARELMSKPLSYGCSKVREAIGKLTNEYIVETLDFFKKEKTLINHQFFEDRGDSAGSSNISNDISAISWLNRLAQGLDFGWGNEIYAGPPTGFGDDGATMMLPHKMNDGCVKLAIWLQQKDKFLEFVMDTSFETDAQ